MFLLGFDFSYKGSVFSTKPTANGTPISFGFFGTYGFKESPLLLGFEVKLHSGSLNTKWDYYGFTFKNTTNFNITQIKFLIGLYASQNFIFQAIFSPQIVSLTFNGDNGSSNLNVIPKENKIVSLSLKFLGRII
jgi:hypothetical protein